jgi:hypothetical protein
VNGVRGSKRVGGPSFRAARAGGRIAGASERPKLANGRNWRTARTGKRLKLANDRNWRTDRSGERPELAAAAAGERPELTSSRSWRVVGAYIVSSHAVMAFSRLGCSGRTYVAAAIKLPVD